MQSPISTTANPLIAPETLPFIALAAARFFLLAVLERKEAPERALMEKTKTGVVGFKLNIYQAKIYHCAVESAAFLLGLVKNDHFCEADSELLTARL